MPHRVHDPGPRGQTPPSDSDVDPDTADDGDVPNVNEKDGSKDNTNVDDAIDVNTIEAEADADNAIHKGHKTR